MGHQLNVQRLELAFQGRPDIIGAIQKAAGLTIPIPHVFKPAGHAIKALLSGKGNQLFPRVKLTLSPSRSKLDRAVQ